MFAGSNQLRQLASLRCLKENLEVMEKEVALQGLQLCACLIGAASLAIEDDINDLLDGLASAE